MDYSGGTAVATEIWHVLQVRDDSVFDKDRIPNLCILVGSMLASGRPLQLWRKFGAVEALILIYLIGPVVTSLLNGDAIYVGASVIPGVRYL